MYDLYAVVNHFGSLGSGHYTALAANQETNTWYSFDDSAVREVPASECINPAAYILFYARKDAVHSKLSELLPGTRRPTPDEKHQMVTLTRKSSTTNRCVLQ
eukprot:g6011.t1